MATRIKSEESVIDEIAGRARRMETKLTMLVDHLGIDHGGKKPVLSEDRKRIYVPTRKTSLDDVMLVAPAGSDVEVYCGEDYLMTVNV